MHHKVKVWLNCNRPPTVSTLVTYPQKNFTTPIRSSDNIAQLPNNVAKLPATIAQLPEHIVTLLNHIVEFPKHVAKMPKHIANSKYGLELDTFIKQRKEEDNQ